MRKQTMRGILDARAWVILLCLAGCAGTHDEPSQQHQAVTQDEEADAIPMPKWVEDPEGAFPSDRGKVLYAVGVSLPIPNAKFAQRRASARARQEMEALVSTHAGRLAKQLAASAAGMPDRRAVEERVRAAIAKSLAQAKEAEFWTAANGAVHCLMALRVEDMDPAIRPPEPGGRPAAGQR